LQLIATIIVQHLISFIRIALIKMKLRKVLWKASPITYRHMALSLLKAAIDTEIA
jgi:hypothetical protein